MADLKTNYKDYVASGDRKYNIAANADGSSSITDVTTYTQTGDTFGASDINATNTAVNALNQNLGTETTRAKAAETDLSNTIKALEIAGVAMTNHTGVALFDSRFSQPPVGNYWYLFFRISGDTSNNDCLLLAFTIGDAENNTVNYKWSIKSGVLINNVVSF